MQVTHVLLTRSRLCPGPKPGSSLHLHVLSTPPAFVLSQDQTLREVPRAGGPTRGNEERHGTCAELRTHRSVRVHDGSSLAAGRRRSGDRTVEPGRASSIEGSIAMRMLSSFQRPPCFDRRDAPTRSGPESIALPEGSARPLRPHESARIALQEATWTWTVRCRA